MKKLKKTSGVIGIDLGTTFSCVGVYKNGRVEIIANTEGSRTTPSVVAFKDNTRLVGEPAKSQSSRNSENTIFGVKRIIGRKFNDWEVQKDIQLVPYKVVEENGNPIIEVQQSGGCRKFTPEQISGFVLREMKLTADKYIGKEVEDVVITVPAYFNDGQRQATKDAAEVAGFKRIRMINEPTAAAIAYGLENCDEEPRTVLIFDLGGGTFDVSIVKISEYLKFAVVVTAGDTHLGGDDFDKVLLKNLAEEFEEKYSLKITENPRALNKLRMASEKAKKDLSNLNVVTVEVDALLDGNDFTSKITRAKFDDLCNDLFQKTIETVEMALKDAKLEKSEIDDIVLVGGSTRIPKIQQLLQTFFENKELKHSVNPDEAVAHGAAIYAAKCFGTEDTEIQELQLCDVTPLSRGVFTNGNVMSTIIERNTPIPTEATCKYVTLRDNQVRVLVQVYEGERAIASENHKLGEFELFGIPPLPRTIGKIDCTMKIDSDGILTVTGVVVANGITNSLTITSDKGRLPRAEIERMVKEAKRFHITDKEHLKRVAARNELENYAYSIRDFLRDRGDCLDKNEFKKCKDAWEEAIRWIGSTEAAKVKTIKTIHNNLKEVCEPIMEKTI